MFKKTYIEIVVYSVILIGLILWIIFGNPLGLFEKNKNSVKTTKDVEITKVSETSAPTPKPAPTPTPVLWPGKMLDINELGKKATLDISNITYDIYRNNQKVENYTGEDRIVFGKDMDYSLVEGVITFRGNNFRNSPSFGVADIKEKKLEIIWSYDIGAISGFGSYWPGVGWTGQPMLVHWDEQIRNIMNINETSKNKDLVEVIYPTLDGNIYFLDMETGAKTRDKIIIGAPTKGTAAIDPRGYPVLYTGQGIPENDTTGIDIPSKYRVFSLIDQELLFALEGLEPLRMINWGAFDSSGLIDRETDTLIECAENGIIYKVKLNTEFNLEEKTLSMNPVIDRYINKTMLNNGKWGMENSPIMYRNLLYIADNAGLLQCIDINTFTPVWIADIDDDTDSTIVLDETDSGVYIYTANEVDYRCLDENGKKIDNDKIKDFTYIRKFNALTGELVWEKGYECYYHEINGGVLATPIIGKNDIENMVIYNVAKTKSSLLGGKLVALDKVTGEEIWVKEFDNYSWSSPVDFIGSDGKTYMLYCNFTGTMYLMDPSNGEILDSISLGQNIEASPAVYDNMIVVGSYAQKIFGIRIK
jgi:hypothetical protein